ncbi:MAG TPA: polyprenyl synthetase family protein [Gemmatimonadales bacterium]|nr:polyprenyl synthetase family protein [Gemmatimonadales bacterium]
MRTQAASDALSDYLAGVRARVDAALARWGGGHAAGQDRVAQAINYSLLGAGKRLRPTLVFACYDAVRGRGAARSERETEGVAELAAAIEVVHAYSLVHDDLPCMDDDDLRRGRPTTHRAFDVATATRAGFRMVALAVRVLAHGLDVLGLDDSHRRAIALELLRAAGAGGMIGGQALDLAAEGGAAALGHDALLEIHQRKTGALIAASCTIGARAAGAPASAIEALRAYGARLGLAFQIYDDVLDATATSAQLGKTAGKDAARAKSTFVTLASVKEARTEAERLAAEAVDRLREAGLASTVLAELARYIVTRPN